MNSPNENRCDEPPLIVKKALRTAAPRRKAGGKFRSVASTGVASSGLDPRSSSPTRTRPTWFSTGRMAAVIESA